MRLLSLLSLSSLAFATPFLSEPSSTLSKRAVHFDIEVTEGTANPDGVKDRMVYLINGKFPGDLMELNEGDDVEVVMKNSASEAITIHWHGIEQTGTPWSDGVPGVTQDATEPGDSFTYRFTVNQYGFYHAHAHRKQQQDDGLYFPIYVKPKSGRENPFEAIAQAAAVDDVDAAVKAMVAAEANPHSIALSDWRHRTSEDIVAVWQETDIEPLCVDAVLINGQGASVCPPASDLQAIADTRPFGNLTAKGCLDINNPLINPPEFPGKPDQFPEDMYKTCDDSGVNNTLARITLTDDEIKSGWAAIQVVGANGLWELAISFDEHPMYVFAVEGQYVSSPEPVEIISVPSGQRFQFFIKLDKEAGSAYTMRVSANVVPQVITGYAILEYGKSDAELKAPAEGYPPIPQSTPYMNYSAGAIDGAKVFEPFTQGPPFPAIPPPKTSNQTLFLEMSRPLATVWAANDTGLIADLFEDMSPLIWDTVWPGVQEAIDNGTGPYANTKLIEADSISFVPFMTTLDLVINVTGAEPSHPMHKHFNKFWVIGQGTGEFEWESVEEAIAAQPNSFNLENPPYRDGFNTPPAEDGSWLVLRYTINDPGPDLLHCHLSQHITGGMNYVILSGMEMLKVPPEYGPPPS